MYDVFFIILNLSVQLDFTYTLYKCVFTNKLSNVAKGQFHQRRLS